jgi:hypothetical protein
MDFNWPLGKIWKGYVNPYQGKMCPMCKGHGSNEATHLLDEDWHAFDNPKYVNIPRSGKRYNDNAHQYHLTQVEVDALLANNRLDSLKKQLGRDPTVEEVNDWAIHDVLGHDSINRWICVQARAEALGVYGTCPVCKGHGSIWDSPELKEKYEAWEPEEPPVGLGFQLWEITTEGSPQSPVFATLDELAAWCEKNATTFGSFKASKEGWIKMLEKNMVHHSEGGFIYI